MEITDLILDKRGYPSKWSTRFDAPNILGIDKVKAIIVDADIEELMKHFQHKVSDPSSNGQFTKQTYNNAYIQKMLVIVNTESIFAVQTKFGNAEKVQKEKSPEDMKSVLKKALDDLKKAPKEYKKSHDKKAEYNPYISKGSVFDPDRYKNPTQKK